MAGPRILVIEARFYDEISDNLLKGAGATLDAAGARWERVTLPGIYELPAALAIAIEARRLAPEKWNFDGYVALGCAIKGETDHYDHVCREATRGLNDLAVAHRLAVGMGILTVHNWEQGIERALPDRMNLGGQAARACLRMIAVKREFGIAGQ